MKKIELYKGKGKTYRCMKRAYKLFKQGKNVIYITPYGMNHAHSLSQQFVCLWVRKHHINYDYIPKSCNAVVNNNTPRINAQRLLSVYLWSWRESNPRPNKAPKGFLHAYPSFDCRQLYEGRRP